MSWSDSSLLQSSYELNDPWAMEEQQRENKTESEKDWTGGGRRDGITSNNQSYWSAKSPLTQTPSNAVSSELDYYEGYGTTTPGSTPGVQMRQLEEGTVDPTAEQRAIMKECQWQAVLNGALPLCFVSTLGAAYARRVNTTLPRMIVPLALSTGYFAGYLGVYFSCFREKATRFVQQQQQQPQQHQQFVGPDQPLAVQQKSKAPGGRIGRSPNAPLIGYDALRARNREQPSYAAGVGYQMSQVQQQYAYTGRPQPSQTAINSSDTASDDSRSLPVPVYQM